MKAGWTNESLIELCDEFTDGNWVESKDQSLEGIRLVQTGNVGVGKFKDRRDKARFINQKTFDRLKCFEVLPGDCLVSRLPDPVGRACEIPDTGDKMITAVDCSIVRTNQSKLLRDYFIYYSQSKEYLSDVESVCSGTTRKRISRKNLGKIQLPLPPLEEQKRIVAILDEAFEGLDRARTHTEANLQNAKELFESALAVSMVGNWMEKRFDEVCVLQRGFDLPKRLRKTGKYDLVTSSGIKDTHSEAKVIGPGVATGRSGSIGKVFYVQKDFWPLNTALYIKEFHGNIPKFIWYFLRHFKLNRFSSGAGVPTLNRNDVHGELVKIPTDTTEQQTIIDNLDLLEKTCDKLSAQYQSKLKDLDDLRQSLLQKAFAGELT